MIFYSKFSNKLFARKFLLKILQMLLKCFVFPYRIKVNKKAEFIENFNFHIVVNSSCSVTFRPIQFGLDNEPRSITAALRVFRKKADTTLGSHVNQQQASLFTFDLTFFCVMKRDSLWEPIERLASGILCIGLRVQVNDRKMFICDHVQSAWLIHKS